MSVVYRSVAVVAIGLRSGIDSLASPFVTRVRRKRASRCTYRRSGPCDARHDGMLGPPVGFGVDYWRRGPAGNKSPYPRGLGAEAEPPPTGQDPAGQPYPLYIRIHSTYT